MIARALPHEINRRMRRLEELANLLGGCGARTFTVSAVASNGRKLGVRLSNRQTLRILREALREALDAERGRLAQGYGEE